MSRRAGRLAALAALMVVAACSSNGSSARPIVSGAPSSSSAVAPASKESAADALKRQIGFLTKDQTGRAYEELHPLQQAFITKELYMECAGASGLTIRGVDVKETYEEEITIPGTATKATSTAITVGIKAEVGGGERTETTTFHEYLVDGHWRFSVTGADDYEAGRCP